MANHPNRNPVEKIRELRREYQRRSSLNTGVIRGAIDLTTLSNEIIRRIRALGPQQCRALDQRPF